MLDKIKQTLTGQKKTKVFLDTNMLLLPGQRGVDVFTGIEDVMMEPFEFCTVQAVFDELLSISEGHTTRRRLFSFRGTKKSAKGADKQSARLGIILAKQKDLKTLGRSSKRPSADEVLLDVVDSNSMVATLDRELQKKLREKDIAVITLRQNKLFTIIK